MVVFVDYDKDEFPSNLHHNSGDNVAPIVYRTQLLSDGVGVRPNILLTSSDCIPATNEKQDDRLESVRKNVRLNAPDVSRNPNINNFSAALSCYPVVKELAKCVDLNTLDSLSRTCRQFRANLLLFRHQLIKLTLRCENEYIEKISELIGQGAIIPDNLKHVIRLLSQDSLHLGRLTSGKIGKCARDMVSGCRRCGRIVCRNCIVKPPSSAMLKHRLRRLCTTCRKAPLACHLSSSTMLNDSERQPSEQIPSFTATLAFVRTPCQCDETVWLCSQCGQHLRSDDTSYRRVWMWRTRYSTFLGGGLGTGIGEGSQGVKCGRGEACLAAKEIEVEVDCETEEPNESPTAPLSSSSHTFENEEPHSHLERLDSREDESPGYLRQEIVGIGGVVKQKVKKRVTLGACVIEHEDEREKGTYLSREETGQHRSWCSWCWRVVPSTKDLLQQN